MIDYTEWDGFGIRFSTDFTSSIDFFGRVCFFFFDRMMRMMMIRIMRMIRIAREKRMIVRVDRALTVKDSWVWMNPSWLEAWIVIDVDGNVDEGIQEMIPVDWLRDQEEEFQKWLWIEDCLLKWLERLRMDCSFSEHMNTQDKRMKR